MNNPRFIASPPLGKLCRWLRTLGFDCTYLREEDLLSTRPHQEGDRIYLTRHVDLKRRRVIFVGEDKVLDQLLVMNLLVSLKEASDPLSRCIECNTSLVDASKQEVTGEVPEHVYISHERFTRCPSCKRLYWPGTHVDRMEERIKAVLG